MKPIVRRGAGRPDQPPVWTASPTAYLSPPGRPDQPGEAVRLPLGIKLALKIEIFIPAFIVHWQHVHFFGLYTIHTESMTFQI